MKKFLKIVYTVRIHMTIVTINVNPFDKYMGEWYFDIRISRKESKLFYPYAQIFIIS